MAKAKATFRLEGEDATAAAFRSAVNNAQGTSKRMASLFKTAFAGVSVAAITGVAMRAIEMGDELNKAAIKAGISGKAMSELAHVAKMADIELGALSTGLKKMQVAMSQAASGGKAQIETLAALGLEIKDIKGLAADRQFELIAQRISEITNPADRARAATELFGKAGADLLPMFEQGASGIRMAREEAVKLGKSLSDDQIKKLADADDSIKRLTASWEGFAAAITVKATPALIGILSLLQGEMPKASIASQLANIDYQMKALEGTKAKRGLRILEDLRKRRAALLAPDELSEVNVTAKRIGLGYAPETPKIDAAAKRSAELMGKWEDEARRAGDVAQLMFDDINFDKLKAELEEAGDMAAILERQLQEATDHYADQTEGAAEQVGKDTAEKLEGILASPFDAIPDRAVESAMRAAGAFDNFFFDPMESGIKGLARDLLNNLRQTLAQVATDKLFGSVASGGFGWGDAITSGAKSLLGFADGGSFRVGGSGGTDSQLVAFNASPDETVSITKPGQSRGGGSPNITVHIDARNSTQEAATIFRQMAPMLIQQAIQGSRSAVRDDFSRGRMR